MDRIIIEKGARYQDRALQAALDWLVRVGGGAIAIDNKRSLESTFGAYGDGQFKRIEEQLRQAGIRLSWRRGRGDNTLPYSGNVVALYPTKWLIDTMESRNLEALLVVGWAQGDFREWVADHDPVRLDVSQGD